MTKTIQEIKTELLQLSDLDDPYFAELLEDQRVGVQKAVIHRQKELLAAKAEDERLDKLLYFERQLYDQGQFLIAGIDEVGRGPLAGPVVAAAVILPVNCKISKLNDSKQIPKKHHVEIFEEIKKQAVAIGIGSCSPEEIDEINIYQAARRAMLEAVRKLDVKPEHLLIDAMRIDSDIPQTSFIKGDAKSMSIAAASIVAKVTRDRLMEDYAKEYPYYDFEHNVGYGTAKHIEGLKNHGICPIHRKTFEPVKSMVEES